MHLIKHKVGDSVGGIHPSIPHSLIDFSIIYVLGAHCRGHMLGKDKAEGSI